VTYGSPAQVADFTACTGTDLDDLVMSLNACPNNPAFWNWVNVGGVLVLCVPALTAILTISFSTPTQVVNYAGVPTTAGDNYPDLCQQTADCLMDRGLLDGVGVNVSALTTETQVQNQYAGSAQMTVRWVDDQGDPRISYKDPVNGWYHPVDRLTAPVTVLELVRTPDMFLVSGSPVPSTLDPSGVPDSAKYLDVMLVVRIRNVSGSGGNSVGRLQILSNSGALLAGVTLHSTHAELLVFDRIEVRNARIRLTPGLDCTFTRDIGKQLGHEVTLQIFATGWGR